MILRISFILVYLFLSIKISHANDVPIIVIAPSKINQSYSTVGTSVTSLNNKEIQENGKFFLGEVLNNNLPGMNYFRSGGYGTVSGVQLRGLPKRYSTVYIDGVKMSDPSSSDNSFYFSNIMTSSIDKVEVLRGSNSSIYGSGAIGGVINIFTKKGNYKETKVNLSVDQMELIT
jgi:vitamin B12 transporter